MVHASWSASAPPASRVGRLFTASRRTDEASDDHVTESTERLSSERVRSRPVSPRPVTGGGVRDPGRLSPAGGLHPSPCGLPPAKAHGIARLVERQLDAPCSPRTVGVHRHAPGSRGYRLPTLATAISLGHTVRTTRPLRKCAVAHLPAPAVEPRRQASSTRVLAEARHPQRAHCGAEAGVGSPRAPRVAVLRIARAWNSRPT